MGAGDAGTTTRGLSRTRRHVRNEVRKTGQEGGVKKPVWKKPVKKAE